MTFARTLECPLDNLEDCFFNWLHVAQEENITKGLLWHHQNCFLMRRHKPFKIILIGPLTNQKWCHFPHYGVNKGHRLLFQCSPFQLVWTVTSSTDFNRLFKKIYDYSHCKLARSWGHLGLKWWVCAVCTTLTNHRPREVGQRATWRSLIAPWQDSWLLASECAEEGKQNAEFGKAPPLGLPQNEPTLKKI